MVAVVTGAALGIGKAITEILLQNGAKVVVLDVNETPGKSLKEDLDKQYGQERTLFLNCDVESQEQIKAALQKTVETFGGIDILNESEWKKTVSVNLTGVMKVAYLALEHMNKLTGGRGGVIVNTASIAGMAHNALCYGLFQKTEMARNTFLLSPQALSTETEGFLYVYGFVYLFSLHL
uniref:Zgc:56585 n=1 Tax=Seriola lalandi dorsalis TaxID=1841481 RepID=A0A3B4XW10_SERLL